MVPGNKGRIVELNYYTLIVNTYKLFISDYIYIHIFTCMHVINYMHVSCKLLLNPSVAIVESLMITRYIYYLEHFKIPSNKRSVPAGDDDYNAM